MTLEHLVSLVDSLRVETTDARETTPLIVKLVRADPSLATVTLRALNEMVRGHADVHPRALCDRCEVLTWAISQCERVVATGLPEIDDDEITSG